jgi:hypothetical protein
MSTLIISFQLEDWLKFSIQSLRRFQKVAKIVAKRDLVDIQLSIAGLMVHLNAYTVNGN